MTEGETQTSLELLKRTSSSTISEIFRIRGLKSKKLLSSLLLSMIDCSSHILSLAVIASSAW